MNCIPPAQMTVVSVKHTNWGQERQKKVRPNPWPKTNIQTYAL